jgi:hypothetical protein
MIPQYYVYLYENPTNNLSSSSGITLVWRYSFYNAAIVLEFSFSVLLRIGTYPLLFRIGKYPFFSGVGLGRILSIMLRVGSRAGTGICGLSLRRKLQWPGRMPNSQGWRPSSTQECPAETSASAGVLERLI